MKKNGKLCLLTLFIVSMLLSSCTTYKESMSQAQFAPIDHKLPKMELVWKNSISKPDQIIDYYLWSPAIRKAIFSEIATNCMETEMDSIVGRIEVDVRRATCTQNPYMAGVSILTLGVLLGMPIDFGTITANIRIRVYDVYDHCLKSYTYYGKDKWSWALYYGHTPNVSADIKGKDIAARFKADLKRDFAELYPNLQTRVYNPMTTEAGKHIQEAIYYCESSSWKKALKELELAKNCQDINDYNRELIQNVGEVAYEGRQLQIQQRNEMLAAIGVGLVAATLVTTAAIAANDKHGSSSPSYTPSQSNNLPPELNPEIAARNAAAQIAYQMKVEEENFKTNYRAWFMSTCGREPSDMEVMEAYTNYLQAKNDAYAASNSSSTSSSTSSTTSMGNSSSTSTSTGKTKICKKLSPTDNAHCNGNGVCSTCNGKKAYWEIGHYVDPCVTCNGTGKCPSCGGTGVRY